MISETRLQAQLDHMAAITTHAHGAKGINRVAFTTTDWEGRRYLMGLMQEAGLEIRTDAFGNVIGHRRGTREDLPAVMCGSHSDSVPEGGNYDGVCGILGAIEVVRSMQEDGFINERPLEIALFMCEESSRFGCSTAGSKFMRGFLRKEDLFKYHDKYGNSIYEVLQSRGLRPDDIETCRYTRPLAAYLELHIEQGKVLEQKGLPLGVVTGIAAPTRLKMHFHGSADHSGATPMALRQDGLCAAAEVVLAVEEAARSHTNPPVVGTVGMVSVEPNAMNVVPGETGLGIDIRSISKEAKDEVLQQIVDRAHAVSKRRGVPLSVDLLYDDNPVPLDNGIIHFLSSCCREAGIPYMEMPSGAGHDAMNWASYCPTGMLFIPCRGGVSHSPEEFARTEDFVQAVGILETALRTLSRADVAIAP
ncbi:MAG: M20 family metallo-hydrolase [Succiniclasticum sp.]|jgi:beta-ureidopropionase / N-carbamoyl-L-amino-acid hydrolase